jgi:2-amino-4-hydroxy-6-hydroxymethyldihydropteridine diphosphokinase
MGRAFIALGSNVGDRQGNLERAIERIGAIPGTRVVARSSFHDTAPVGGPPQARFLNGAIEVESKLGPPSLLFVLQQIEAELGRERSVPLGPRTIDLDLLLYDGGVVETKALTIPHPRMHERGFVLAPLVEIAADVRVPGKGATVSELYDRWRASVGAPPGAAEPHGFSTGHGPNARV